jgi:hypothetical protein
MSICEAWLPLKRQTQSKSMVEGVAYAAMLPGFLRPRQGTSNAADDGCKKWLTVVTKIPSAMTLVPQLLRIDHHFSLDFIFH